MEPPRTKTEIVQCRRCHDYGHTKAYRVRPFKCVKCGKQKDLKTCKKSKVTPTTYAPCHDSYFANYKGCTAYNTRNIAHPKWINRSAPQIQDNSIIILRQLTSQQNYHQNTRSTYAQVTRNEINANANNSHENLENK